MATIENNINGRIEDWKKSLLDMTKRNRLLWYRPYRVGSLPLKPETFDEKVENVFDEVDKLAFNGKTWEFITEFDAPKAAQPGEKLIQSSLEEYAAENDEAEEDDKQKDIEKRTRSLLNIYNKIKQESEEKGLNIGYIAVGFLEWYERNDSATKIKTPLILVPVKVEQDGRRTPFKVSLNTDEQITLNPIIQKKFETDFNLTLEELPTNFDGDANTFALLANIKNQIPEDSNWQVKEEIILDTFSFQNLAIWNDLEKNKDLIANNSFSRVLAGGNLTEEGFAYDQDGPDLEKTKSEDNLNIYEMDSSQQEAVCRAKNGESFVIQGPPGTGKSQTITNIIAEMLYLGKKVLFVSEKQAALDVVYHKLEQKNLADFCLILHNSKAKKQDIRHQIAKSLELSSDRKAVTNEALDVYDMVDEKRTKLNRYVEKLHEKPADNGITPYQLIGEIDRLRTAKNLIFKLPTGFTEWSATHDAEVAELFRKVDEYGKSLIDNTKHFSDNYWQYYQGELDNTTKRKVQESVCGINEAILAEKIEDFDPKNIITTSREFFKILDSIPFTQAEHQELDATVAAISQTYDQIKSGNHQLKTLKESNEAIKKDLTENWTEDFLNLENPEIYRKKLVNKYGTFLSRLSSDYKNFIGKLDALSLNKMKHNDYVHYLDKLISYRANLKTITESEGDLAALSLKHLGYFKQLGSQAEAKKAEILQLLEKLDFDSLSDYQHYTEARNELLNKYKLDDFIATIENGNEAYSADEIADIFKKRFLVISLEMTDFDKEYAKYDHLTHSTDVNEFRRYDAKTFAISAARIRCELFSKMPNFSLFSNQAHGGEIQLLQRELKKKNRLMPTRTLIKNLPVVLPTLKPCMMMSPLTVSSYFSLNPSWKFDVVIFDEASQVKPEYAITSIIRGKQVIVAGDSKQMPPTNFFDSVNDDDEEYDEENPKIDNLESILDEMSTAFPDVYLNWHYRSKDESLIAFSNHKFYNSRLNTFPAPYTNGNLGVSFVYCPNGVWENKNGNRPEAEMVAKIVLDHIKNHPDQSLGIVTFGKSQEYAVSSAIDKLRDAYPECESFFNENKAEPFFVKNLERVQGDERDRIIISCGYGKDPSGTFAMRFGPLAMDGGERRLNVAISRARRSMAIVASFRASEIRGTDSSPQRRLIRDFIDYAEHGISALLGDEHQNDSYTPIFDSGFEEDVYHVLTREGFKLRTQVGSSGYKIDMAVLHPTIDGRFVLAIECDGAAYHSSRTARDRDILRQKILEGQGWKFHRIWSTDWYHDNANSQKRLLSAIRNAIENYDKNPTPAEPTATTDQPNEQELVIEAQTENTNDTLTKIYNSWTTKLQREFGMSDLGFYGNWKNDDSWDSLYTMEHYDHIPKIIEEILPYKNGFSPEDVFREINQKVFKKNRYSAQADKIYNTKFQKHFIDTGKVEIVDGSIRVK